MLSSGEGRVLARVLLTVLSVVLVAACTAGPTTPHASAGTPVAGVVVLRTEAPQSLPACPEARVEGVLVRHPQSGVGLRNTQGTGRQVIWPGGYSARDDAGRLAVLDETGKVLAHEGDRVEIGGQDVGGPWLGCGGLNVLAP